jgi:hypothetical protein
MGKLRIAYTPRPGVTPEDEARVLAAVYRFVLQAQERKKGARPGAPDDVRRDHHAHTRTILP